MKKILTIITIGITIISCGKKKVDTIIYNAKIYTVDANFSVAEAMVIDNKKVVAVGRADSLLKIYDANEKIDIGGKTIFPGFIDAHAHFLGYGLQLKTVNLFGTKSWEEIIDRIAIFEKENLTTGNVWITGRGWDQNDWASKEFPTNEALNKRFPNNPILLTRIDGHAAIANDKALQLANIQPNQQLVGGTVQTINGKLTGVLIDNAVDLVQGKIPAATRTEKIKALQNAQQNCFAVGLTTVDECGMDFEDVELLKELYKKDSLQMKLYVMLSDAKKNYDYLIKNGKYESEQLHVLGFKVYGDGALGSRGACLLNPYHDRPNEQGFLLSSLSHFDSVANLLYTNKMQMCTHAIGDSANSAILNIYAKYLKGQNDLRWRIEHAQVVAPEDFDLFGKYSIVPSVQPTHATSDMYWAADRLGPTRIKGAYAYQDLLKQNNWVPLGTDFPVEDISTFKTFYASVVRKDNNNFPANGFQIENALTREQTIRGMTIWAAKSNFEEKVKGSLETGKYADFIVLDTDLMQCNNDAILNTKVLSTWVSGRKVYNK